VSYHPTDRDSDAPAAPPARQRCFSDLPQLRNWARVVPGLSDEMRRVLLATIDVADAAIHRGESADTRLAFMDAVDALEEEMAR